MESGTYYSNLKELHRSFKPILYISKISGLLPNEMREVKGNLITVRSKFSLIQTATFIVFYSGVIYFMKKNDINFGQSDCVSIVVENIRLLAFELIFYIVLLSAIIKQKEFLETIKHISELDSLLFQSGEEINYRKEFKKNIILVGLFCATYVNLGVIELLRNYQPGFEYILHTLMWFPPSILMHLVLLQFAVMVASLKVRCSKLNNAVSALIKLTKKQNLNVVPNIEIQYQDPQTAVNYSYNITDTIWNLSVIYDVICNICKTINKVFALQVTFGLGATSVFLTFIIYEITTYAKQITVSYNWQYFASSFQILLLHVSTILGITYCCNGVKCEVDEVAILLHKVKPKRGEHREAINTFSLQLMHQKVQFTACGLFNLDFTFIYLLISTITTYMVILVQFGQAVGS